jgi:hypothetical protein
MNNTCDQELLLLLLLLLLLMMMMMMKTYSNILDRFFMCLQFFFVYKMRIFFIYNYPTGGTWLWTAKKIEFRKIVWSLGSYEFLPHPITLFMIISKKFAVCTSSCRDPSLQQFIYYIL